MPQGDLNTIVQRMIDAGEPEENIATVIRHYKAQPQEPPSGPMTRESFNAALAQDPEWNRRMELAETPEGNAAALGAAAAPFTAGMSLIPAVATHAAAGAVGSASAGGGLTPGAVLNAATEGLGRGAGGALRLAGRGLYRAGALPLVEMFGKYGDLVKQGVEQAVPVTRKGLTKAGGLKTAAQAKKAQAIAGVDENVMFRAPQLSANIQGKLAPKADLQRRAGMGDPSKGIRSRANALVTENPAGIKPSELEAIKGTVDDQLGGAFRKIRKREPLSSKEQFGVAQTEELGEAMASAVPDYKGLNRDVMNAAGLERMVGRRLAGGNQGLENAMFAATAPFSMAAIPARMAMLPQVLTPAGIGAYHAGKAAPTSMQALRAAILNLLANPEGQQDER